MKTNHLHFNTILLGLLLFTVFSLSSCKKDEVNPDYVGTWAATGSFNTGSVNLEMKDQFTLSKGSYSEIILIKDPDTNKWLEYMAQKGTISVTDSTINFTLLEVGISTIEPITSKPTGIITYYKKGQTQYDILLSEFGFGETVTSKYSISGGAITLKTDYNKDGDYDDENEYASYLKI